MNKYHITKNDLQSFVDMNLSIEDISKNYNCSKTNIRHYLRKYGLNTNCVIKYTKEEKLMSIKKNNKKSYIKQKERGKSRRLSAIKHLGGKCSLCGYCKNSASLAFHHVDPRNKNYRLDVRKFSNTNIESLYKEIEKCVLLCHNCHFEIHNPDCFMDT